MKKILFLLVALMPMGLCAQTIAEAAIAGQKAEAAAQAAAAMQTEQSPEEAMAERNKMLYSLGFLLGDNLKKQLILDNEDDYKALSQGMRDSLLNKTAQTDLETYKPTIIEKYTKDAATLEAKRAEGENEYMESFKKEKGVKTLENGAMIKLTRKGKGTSPKADSVVKVNYEGKLLDGTKFDSSYERKEPFQTRLNAVIGCWTKAVQMMKEGSKATVVCPADTAYGNRPVGAIPANSMLIFDIELLDVVQ